MTELEKLEAGLEYSFWDKEVNARKQHAMQHCAILNAIVSGGRLWEEVTANYFRRNPLTDRAA